MKKIFLIFLIFSSSFLYAQNKWSDIVDYGLKSCIRSSLNCGSECSDTTLANATRLNCTGYNIKTLQGIDVLEELTYLSIDNGWAKTTSNKVQINAYNYYGTVNGSYLDSMEKLKTLIIKNAGLKTFPVLSNVRSLSALSLSGNSISDATELQNFPMLTQLNLENNELDQLSYEVIEMERNKEENCIEVHSTYCSAFNTYNNVPPLAFDPRVLNYSTVNGVLNIDLGFVFIECDIPVIEVCSYENIDYLNFLNALDNKLDDSEVNEIKDFYIYGEVMIPSFGIPWRKDPRNDGLWYWLYNQR